MENSFYGHDAQDGNAQGLVLWGLCCGDCAVCYRSTYGIKVKEKEFCLVLKPEGNMGLPRFRAFLLLFLILCFPISFSKSPRILAAKLCTKEGNLTSPAAASKAAVILRAQSLYWHTDLMICTAQGIKCFKKLTLLRRPCSSCISVPSFVWGWEWLWEGQEEPDGSINETLWES